MLLKKKNFPEEEELTLCTVTKVFHHGVFVDMDEYGKGGMIHISEVSPGRIRNIRDYVKEGKKVVCKVLRIDTEKGHIDLSLRRVNEGQKKGKINEIKQEQKAEKIIEFVAKQFNMDVKKLYEELSSKILEKYDLLHYCFEDIVKGEFSLGGLDIDKEKAEALTKLVMERMKPQEVFVGGELKLRSYMPDGVDVIKNTLKKAVQGGNIDLTYEGGGLYAIRSKANEYKDAEKILEKAVSNALSFIESHDGSGEFVKKE
ncbi:MAG: translation initiation factor IF-2 subunit alpha [Nanoarchaeota archaeon]|nr:translation initiation factor IF-2 subunit alpha [Nanoarchaeota archaeon]